jgi:hypothetical protein
MGDEKQYQFVCKGKGANGVTWTVSGAVEADWPDVFDRICPVVFEKLTRGQAQYGDPSSCTGPYTIQSLLITRVYQ